MNERYAETVDGETETGRTCLAGRTIRPENGGLRTRDETADIPGDSLSRLRYAFQPAALLLGLLFVAATREGSVVLLLAALFASLVTATAVGLWRGDERGLAALRCRP